MLGWYISMLFLTIHHTIKDPYPQPLRWPVNPTDEKYVPTSVPGWEKDQASTQQKEVSFIGTMYNTDDFYKKYLLLLLSLLYSRLLGLGRFFSFLILNTVGRTPWTGDQPFARPLPTYRTT
jgi:hypothetical protein